MTKTLLLITLVLVLVACEESPTGRKQLALVPDSQLTELGTQAFTDLKRTQRIETDPRINAYVRCVTAQLLGALPEQDQSWEVVVFSNPTPNAFALPGGKIGVNTGMLQVATNPAQLATVIGHEIGHVLADHANERLTQELAVQGGLLLIDLLTDDPSGWKHDALRQALGLGAQVGLLLPFSRTHESEADTIGLELMARAGFDPRQSPVLWKNMTRAGGEQPPEFLSTHPSHETRFEALNAQLNESVELYQTAIEQNEPPSCS